MQSYGHYECATGENFFIYFLQKFFAFGVTIFYLAILILITVQCRRYTVRCSAAQRCHCCCTIRCFRSQLAALNRKWRQLLWPHLFPHHSPHPHAHHHCILLLFHCSHRQTVISFSHSLILPLRSMHRLIIFLRIFSHALSMQFVWCCCCCCCCCTPISIITWHYNKSRLAIRERNERERERKSEREKNHMDSERERKWRKSKTNLPGHKNLSFIYSSFCFLFCFVVLPSSLYPTSFFVCSCILPSCLVNWGAG